MRKLVSSTIIVLPLLLLAILLVSGAVVSVMTHIYVENIEFQDKEAIVLVMDDEKNPPTYNLGKDITILPLKASNRDLVYTTEDDSLVEVNNRGVVKARFYGETYVTVQSKENKGAVATRKVIITDSSVHILEMNEYKKDLYEGESLQLSVRVYPEEADNKAIKWTSSNNDVLSVSRNGTITALGNGRVTITATAQDDTNGLIQATATIDCHAKLRDLIFDDSLLETAQNEVQFPSIKTSPSDCDTKYEYSSSNEEIATVDDEGVIRFEKEGRVTITVKATDYKGNKVEKSKEFISTNGYFAGSLFNTHSIDFDDCVSGAKLPIEFNPNPSGSSKLIGKIECGKDNSNIDASLDDLISYDEGTKTFRLTKELPEFNNYIFVKVNATVYDYQTNGLKDTYDYFYITKTEIQENAHVYNNGSELVSDQPNLIEFHDIGEQINLTIENPDNLIVKVEGNASVDAIRNGNTVTLTSKLVCEENDNVTIQLSIGTKIYVLKMKISAKAEYLNVSSGDTIISKNATYKTLIDSLSFEVEKGRADNQNIVSPIKYQINDEGEWKEVTDSSVTIDTKTTNKITFVCDDVEFSFNIQKITLGEFGFDVFFNLPDGSKQDLEGINNINANRDVKITLPSNIQNNITLKLNIDYSEYLGGLGDKKTNQDFEKMFNVNLNGNSDWEVGYDASKGEIVIEFVGTEFNKTIALTYGSIKLNLQLLKVNIKTISFVKGTESFDISKDEDVLKGYQQVRVFAKHSYYGKEVDYFKIPLNAVSNTGSGVSASVDTITWKLSRYVKDNMEEVLASQLGDTVIIGGETYKIEEVGNEYVLKNSNGDIVSGQGGKNNDGYIWVDAYSEKDYARIYFGKFAGLSESDVYNNYFGHFYEKVAWSEPELVTDTKDGGNDVNPSSSAYSFLRVEAGDGVAGGKNCHFNFNVLNDIDSNHLVNVFDTDGYYANSNIVLHNSLYGEGEIDNAPTNQIIKSTNTNELQKTYVFGNGYKINLRAWSSGQGTKNESNRVTFNRLYNVTLFGDNANEKIDGSVQKGGFNLEYVYYSDLRYYYKSDPAGDNLYVKNSTFYGVPKVALQSWQSNTKIYIENVVFAGCSVAVSLEQPKANAQVNIKGFFDVLNYNNREGLDKPLNGMASAFIGTVINAAQNYVEIFGNKATGTEIGGKEGSAEDYYGFDHLYVNVVIYATANISNKVLVWDEQSKGYVNQTNNNAVLENGEKLVNINLAFSYFAWTYDVTNDTDGLHIDAVIDRGFMGSEVKTYEATRSDMKQIFTEDRDIRLLCQYLEKGKSNTDHIQWHMEKVVRDINLIKGRTHDHLDHLIETLRNKNITWPDNVKADDVIREYEQSH